jgi:hypothetical protein
MGLSNLGWNLSAVPGGCVTISNGRVLITVFALARVTCQCGVQLPSMPTTTTTTTTTTAQPDPNTTKLGPNLIGLYVDTITPELLLARCDPVPHLLPPSIRTQNSVPELAVAEQPHVGQFKMFVIAQGSSPGGVEQR